MPYTLPITTSNRFFCVGPAPSALSIPGIDAVVISSIILGSMPYTLLITNSKRLFCIGAAPSALSIPGIEAVISTVIILDSLPNTLPRTNSKPLSVYPPPALSSSCGSR